MSLALISEVGVKAYITEKQLLVYGLRVAMRGRRRLRFLIFQLQEYSYMTKDYQPGLSLLKFHYLLNAVGWGLSFITGTSMGQSCKPQNQIWVRSYDTSYAWLTSRNKIIYSSFHVVACINDIILDFTEFCFVYCCVFFIHLLQDGQLSIVNSAAIIMRAQLPSDMASHTQGAEHFWNI